MAHPPGHLNVFQRLVLQWEALHPYNAAQMLRVEGAPPLATLSHAWREALDELGLGAARTNGKTFAFEHLNGVSPRDLIRRVPADQPIAAFLSDEMNRPFGGPGDFTPFRPFVQQCEGHFYVGIVYQHWVADSYSIRLLLREWFLRCYDPSKARRAPLKLAAGGYWGMFGPHRGGWRLGEGLLQSIRWSSRCRRVRRIDPCDDRDPFRVSVSIYPAKDGLITALRAAERNGATLHDLFVAAAAEACHKFVPVRFSARRQDLALGSIVDLRPFSHQNLDDTFGLFLGFTSTLCRPEDFRDWPRLLHVCAMQGDVHKKTGVPLASSVRMFAGLTAGKFLSPQKLVTFYRKRVPLAGGISNVNLNQTWARQYHPSPILDYVRVAPTGPMMPLVLTTTTLGDRFQVALTRRAAVVDQATADAVAASFLRRLQHLADAGDAFSAEPLEASLHA